MGDDRYLDLDDARLRYRDEGAGPAVILVHGWTLDLDVWEPQVEALQKSFRVVRFDRRGFGSSTGQPDLSRDSADIDALATHLNFSRFALLGMSQGARPCLQYALARQETVSCLILDGCPDVLGEAGAAAVIPLLTRSRELVARGGVQAFLREWRAHPLMQLRSDMRRHRELLDRVLGRYPGNDLMPPYSDDARSLSADQVKGISVPALLMTGEHDASERSEVAAALASLLPNAQRAVILRAGHMASLENPQQYNAVLLSFLEQHWV